ncbi:MAG: chorismate-binding protein [Candidatus Saccharimonadales bacterium]
MQKNILSRHVTVVPLDETPAQIYRKLATIFTKCALFETGSNNTSGSISYIAAEPIMGITTQHDVVEICHPECEDGKALSGGVQLSDELASFVHSFEIAGESLPFADGLFGYTAYDATRYFKNIHIKTYASNARAIPDMQYWLYRYVVAVRPYTKELFLIEYTSHDESSRLDQLQQALRRPTPGVGELKPMGDERTSVSDEHFLTAANKLSDRLKLGEVSQLALSRSFAQDFTGDDFAVYMRLATNNPSPYQYYFDYDDFRLIGTAAETQTTSLDDIADDFPANAVTGTPKYRAIQLIDQNEPHNRGYYGGRIGMVSFNGSFIDTVMAQAILSKHDTLYYQASVDIAGPSKADDKLQEVYSKLDPVLSAIQRAAPYQARL